MDLPELRIRVLRQYVLTAVLDLPPRVVGYGTNTQLGPGQAVHPVG